MGYNIAALAEAIRALERTPQERKCLLAGKIRDIARKGRKAKLSFNELTIRYLIRDELGNLNLRWLVTNGITGSQKTYYTKDFMSKKGKVLWRFLAARMNET